MFVYTIFLRFYFILPFFFFFFFCSTGLDLTPFLRFVFFSSLFFFFFYYPKAGLYLISWGWVKFSFLHPNSLLTAHLATLAAVSYCHPSVKGFVCARCWSQTHYLPLHCLYAIVLYNNVYVHIQPVLGFTELRGKMHKKEEKVLSRLVLCPEVLTGVPWPLMSNIQMFTVCDEACW